MFLIKQIKEERYIFFYGGTDRDWILKFKTTVKTLAERLKSSGEKRSIEWVLIGNNVDRSEGSDDENAIENVELFWTQVESMCSIKLQKEVDAGREETLKKLLSCEREIRWAMLSKGSEVVIADHGTKIKKALKKLLSQETEFREEFKAILTRYCNEVNANFNTPSMADNHIQTGGIKFESQVQSVEEKITISETGTVLQEHNESIHVEGSTTAVPSNEAEKKPLIDGLDSTPRKVSSSADHIHDNDHHQSDQQARDDAQADIAEANKAASNAPEQSQPPIIDK